MDYGGGVEILSSVSAQHMDTSGFQVFDRDETEFHWEDPELNMDAIFRRRISTPSSPSNFNDFELGSTAEKPVLIDAEQVRELSSSSNNCNLWEFKPSRCVAEKLPPLQHEWKLRPNIFTEICLNNIFYCYRVCIPMKNIVELFHFIRFSYTIQSETCEKKTVLVLRSLFLIIAASFCFPQVHTEKK